MSDVYMVWLKDLSATGPMIPPKNWRQYPSPSAPTFFPLPAPLLPPSPPLHFPFLPLPILSFPLFRSRLP